MSSEDGSKTKKRRKTTNEKPISLHPLKFEDALRDLLVTPPPLQKGVKAKSDMKPTKSKDNK